MSVARWIGVDWGTTHLRAAVIGAEGEVLADLSSGAGMGQLSPETFEPALLQLIEPFLGDHQRPTPVIACGMVGSRQGWREAPYRSVPCAPVDPVALVSAPVADPRLTVHIVPGLSQAAPADVMRGEETQIAGLLAARPNWDGVLCLPGTHTKWVQVSAGEVVSFRTFMTGELFALLGAHSVLRHGIASAGWQEEAFAAAVTETLARPERLAADLFGLRAAGLLHGLDGETARAWLSGLLIGAELVAARPYWLGQDVLVIGAEEVSGAYRAALALQGVTAGTVPGRDAVLAGLAIVAAGFLKGSTV